MKGDLIRFRHFDSVRYEIVKTHLRSNALRRAGARFRAVARGVKRKAPDLTLVRLWLFAVLVGAATAYGVILFRAGINAVSMFSYGANEEMFASGAASVSFLRSWATPIVGGFVVSAILFLADRFGWLEQGRGQGVPEVIEARAVKDGRISLRAGAAAAVVSTSRPRIRAIRAVANDSRVVRVPSPVLDQQRKLKKLEGRLRATSASEPSSALLAEQLGLEPALVDDLRRSQLPEISTQVVPSHHQVSLLT